MFMPDLKAYQISRLATLFLLFILLLAGAIPSYLTGHWPWMKATPLPHLQDLKKLRKTGLVVPGWQSLIYRRNVPIGGRKWIAQELKNPQVTAILLLLPQGGVKEQPQVEWVDINGFHRWKTDAYQPFKFTIPKRPGNASQENLAQIDARFFRSFTPKQTFAVLQWYAWPNGGSPYPSDWFWRDRKAQLSNTRVPWVAVSILLPIEPLGEIKNYQPLIESMGQDVQSALSAEVFKL